MKVAWDMAAGAVRREREGAAQKRVGNRTERSRDPSNDGQRTHPICVLSRTAGSRCVARGCALPPTRLLTKLTGRGEARLPRDRTVWYKYDGARATRAASLSINREILQAIRGELELVCGELAPDLK